MGQWRQYQPPFDERRCVRALTSLAWHGARDDPINGLADWATVITGWEIPDGLSDRERSALDHVAPHSTAAGARVGSREFVHRTIREHLVAEHIAGLSSADAAAALVPHLWFDPIWEDVVPRALAAHSERDDVLHSCIQLSGCAAGPASIPQIDGLLELQLLLARVAGQTAPEDWSAESAEIIQTGVRGLRPLITHNARADEAMSGIARWAQSFAEIEEWLRDSLAHDPSYSQLIDVADALVQVDLRGSFREDVVEGLVRGLGREDAPWRLYEAETAIASLADTSSARASTIHAAAALCGTMPLTAASVASTLGLLHRLAPTPEEWSEVASALISRIRGADLDEVLAIAESSKEPPPELSAQLRKELIKRLSNGVNAREAAQITIAVEPFGLTADETTVIRRELCRYLGPTADLRDAQVAAFGLSAIGLTPTDQEQLVATLKTHIAAAHDEDDLSAHLQIESIMDILASTDTGLAKLDDILDLDPKPPPYACAALASAYLSSLRSTAAQRAKLTELLLDQLTVDAWQTTKILSRAIGLAYFGDERRELRQAIVRRLSPDLPSWLTIWMVQEAQACGQPTEPERASLQRALLATLSPDSRLDMALTVVKMIGVLAESDAALEQLLHDRLPPDLDPSVAIALSRASHADSEDERSLIRHALVHGLATKLPPSLVAAVVRALAPLRPSVSDQEQMLRALKRSAAHNLPPDDAVALAEIVGDLAGVGPSERTTWIDALLAFVADSDLLLTPGEAARLFKAVVALGSQPDVTPQSITALLALAEQDLDYGLHDEITAALTALGRSAEEADLAPETQKLEPDRLRALSRHSLAPVVQTATAMALRCDETTAELRASLLTLLPGEGLDDGVVSELADAVVRLGPTAPEVFAVACRAVSHRSVQVVRLLGAAARARESVEEWLDALPSAAPYTAMIGSLSP